MSVETKVFDLNETIDLLKNQPLEPFNLEHVSAEYKSYLDALKTLFKDVPDVSIDNFSYTFDTSNKTLEINCYASNNKYKACFIVVYTKETPQSVYSHVSSVFKLDKYPPKGVFNNFDIIDPLVLDCMDKIVELSAKFIKLISITDLAELKKRDVSLIFDTDNSTRIIRAINVQNDKDVGYNLFSAILVEQKKEPKADPEKSVDDVKPDTTEEQTS